MITNIVQSMQINTINKELEYKCYILQHLANIKKAYILYKDFLIEKLELRDSDVRVISDLVRQHDDSKWDLEEFDAYRKHFYPTLQENEMVQDMKDRLEKDFDAAWEHHYKNNPHHWQYWGKDNDIPNVYIAEMILDWIAMGMAGSKIKAYDWYDQHRDEIQVTDNARIKLDETLAALRELDNPPVPEEEPIVEEMSAEDPLSTEEPDDTNESSSNVIEFPINDKAESIDDIVTEEVIESTTVVEEAVETVHVDPEDVIIE